MHGVTQHVYEQHVLGHFAVPDSNELNELDGTRNFFFAHSKTLRLLSGSGVTRRLNQLGLPKS